MYLNIVEFDGVISEHWTKSRQVDAGEIPHSSKS